MTSPDISRRSFLRGKIKSPDKAVIRPPWSLEEATFIERCNRCNSCISACPEKIITAGDGGFPEINFRQGECTFCHECVNSCEANAFKPINLAALDKDAWSLKIEILSKCLSLNAVVCRICGDNCDEQAISFKLQLGGVSTPVVDNGVCTGCGNCLFTCPENAISIQNKSLLT